MKINLNFKNIFFCLLLVSFELFNAQASFEWAKEITSTGQNDYGRSITTDAYGNVYTTGFFTGTADFDPGPGIFNLTSIGNTDAFVSKLDVNGNFIWAKQFGGFATFSGLARGRSVTVDAAGNVYTTGTFFYTVDFDPGPGVFNLATSGGNYDIFISKLDAAGNFVWAKGIGGITNDDGNSITTDASGNVFTTGYFTGIVDFDPSASTYTMNGYGGQEDAFILKLDASGNFAWVKQFIAISGSPQVFGNGITLDGLGNIVIGGSFSGQIDFDTGPGTYTIAAINFDIFIAKLNSSGNFIWVKQMGGPGSGSELKGIVTDVSNNIYATGYFDQTIDLDPGPGTYSFASFGSSDIFVNKLDASGNFVWAKQMGGTSGDMGVSIALSNLGDVYTTGYFGYPFADFDPGPGTYTLANIGGGAIYISKLDGAGNFSFADGFGTSGSSGYGIAVDNWYDIYTTGNFSQLTDFDPGPSTYTLATNGGNAVLIHKLKEPGCPTFSLNSTTNSYSLMCSLNTLTLNAINTTTYSGVTYTWTAPSLTTAIGATYICNTGGIYTISASASSNTCVVTQVLSIIQSTGNVNYNILTNGSTCNNNGTATVSLISGTSPYTYTWSAGGTGTNVSNLAPGNYTVKVTDANICSFTQSFAIINAAAPYASAPICFVTVDSLSQYNVITWDKTQFPNADSFFVYRETGTNFYQKIRSQPFSDFSRFVDTVKTLYFPNTGNPNVGTYRYKIKTLDSCDNYSDLSPYHNTLFMINNNGTFSWTQLYAIEGNPNPVLSYILERDDLNNNNWAAVGSVAGTQQFIIDPNYTSFQATAAWRVRTQWSISCIPSRSTSSLTASYSNRVTNNTVGVKENKIDNYLTIYPNPSNGKLNIVLKNASVIGKKMNLDIHNVTGEKIYSSNGEIFNSTQIDLSGYSSGMYFVTFTTDAQITKGKIILEK